MKPNFTSFVFLLVTLYVGSSLFALIAEDFKAPKQSFRRTLEIEIDRSSDFARSKEYDALSEDQQELYGEMQLRMALLLRSVVEFQNSQDK